MSEQRVDKSSPCQACGACCAAYRVSFYWSEADARGLPVEMTERVNPWISCMAGTGLPTLRCSALHGQVGHEVACSVYENRPSPCREVEPGDAKCNKARVRHGLPPLAKENPGDRASTTCSEHKAE